jgi:YfiH family protein
MDMSEHLCFFQSEDIKKTQMNERFPHVFKIPSWEGIPFLVHGFGTKYWKEEDFKRHEELRDFRLQFLRQIHSDIIHIIDKIPVQRLTGDAMLTRRKGVLLIIKTADCLPILMVDRTQKAVAAVHCGWKSTSRGLIRKVVKSMEMQFGCESSSLLIAMGPCIGRCCYEVGDDVRQEFERNGLSLGPLHLHTSQREKYFLDLKEANGLQLVDVGVSESKISELDLCTHCDDDLLSYRRDRKSSGRMLSFIGLSF